MTPPHGLADLIAIFGDPVPFVNRKEAWEDKVLRTVSLPTLLPYAYAAVNITRVRAHGLIVHDLVNVLMACLRDGVPRERLQYGGCYCWRPKRSNGRELSTHTWGIAVDLEPIENPVGQDWNDDGVMMHPRVIERFKQAGWRWGGDFKTPDPMHFQFAHGY